MTTANATGIIAAVTGALAMLCSALLVATYFGFRELQNEWRWLLVLLSLCDFFQGLFYLCATFWQPTQADEYQCMAQTVFGSFFASASFLWTACISYYVRQLIRLDGTTGTKLSWLLPRFHVISWGIPAAVLVVFVGVDMSRDPLDRIAGPVADHDGCYIPAKYVGWRLLTIYAPLWGSWGFTLSQYLLTHRHISRVMEQQRAASSSLEAKSIREVRLKLVLIPAVFIVCRIWESAFRVIGFFRGLHDGDMQRGETGLSATAFGEALEGSMAFFNPAQGIFNCIIFVFGSAKARRLVSGRLRWALCACGGARDAWGRLAGGGGGKGGGGGGGGGGQGTGHGGLHARSASVNSVDHMDQDLAAYSENLLAGHYHVDDGHTEDDHGGHDPRYGDMQHSVDDDGGGLASSVGSRLDSWTARGDDGGGFARQGQGSFRGDSVDRYGQDSHLSMTSMASEYGAGSEYGADYGDDPDYGGVDHDYDYAERHFSGDDLGASQQSLA